MVFISLTIDTALESCVRSPFPALGDKLSFVSLELFIFTSTPVGVRNTSSEYCNNKIKIYVIVQFSNNRDVLIFGAYPFILFLSLSLSFSLHPALHDNARRPRPLLTGVRLPVRGWLVSCFREPHPPVPRLQDASLRNVSARARRHDITLVLILLYY